MEEQDIQNLEEIINLCKNEIDNDDKNISATLDLEDLKSLSNVLSRYKSYRKQLNDAFTNGYIHKEKVKETIEEIVSGLQDLVLDRESFINDKSDKENIFVRDKEILQDAINLILKQQLEIDHFSMYILNQGIDDRLKTATQIKTEREQCYFHKQETEKLKKLLIYNV